MASIAPVAPAAAGRQTEGRPAVAPTRRGRWATRRVDLIVSCMLALLAAGTAAAYWQLATAPFWFDEQVRAYDLTQPGLHTDLHNTYAPMAFGWMLLEKLAVLVLGAHEWAFRSPMILAWVLLGPAAYLVGRRLAPRPIAFGVAAALVVNPAVVYYAMQLKPYAVEALVTLASVLVWSHARASGATRRRLGWYGALSGLGLLSVPAPFVIAPLLTLDLARAARRRHAGWHAAANDLAAPALAGAVVLVEMVAFVLPQTFDLHYPNWQGLFLPHGTAAVQVVARQLPTFLAGSWTGLPLFGDPFFQEVVPPALPSALALVGNLVVGALVLAGSWSVRRHPLGRGLVAVLLGGGLLQLVASGLREWPFGLTRVDLFVVPVIYLLAGAGLAALARAAVSRRARGGVRPRQLRPGAPSGAAPAWLGRAAFALALGVLSALVSYGVRGDLAIGRDLPLTRWDQGVRSAVARARQEATAGTVAIVLLDGQGGFGRRGKGWAFYMDSYDYPGRLGRAPRVPLDATWFATDDASGVSGATGFLRSHPGARQVLLYDWWGMGRDYVARQAEVLRAAGYHPAGEWTYAMSGTLTRWRH
ncbi:MAG TPA: hypothetical protein VMU75_09325 [Acidimicrobiales bacterium]|nr:hypothetical protein [Acidimicrobiales bacterium]